MPVFILSFSGNFAAANPRKLQSGTFSPAENVPDCNLFSVSLFHFTPISCLLPFCPLPLRSLDREALLAREINGIWKMEP